MVKNITISNSKTEATRLALLAEFESIQGKVDPEDIDVQSYPFTRSDMSLRITKDNFDTFFLVTPPVLFDPHLFALAKKASEALADIEQYIDMKYSSLE